MEDVVRSLGFLCLGSRLKRLGERMQSDTQRILDRLDLPVQASQHPLLAALHRLGPLGIGELAEALGVSQPGVTRNVARLRDLGLVEASKSGDDQRQKMVSLSDRGRKLVEEAMQGVWPEVESAVAGLCGGVTGSFLEQLDAIEDALAATPLDRRAGNAGSRVR